jgi:hypothetical protein
VEPTIPWYQSGIIRQQILAFCLSAFAMLKTVGWIAPDTVIDFEGTITAVLAFVSVCIPLYTIVTRALKPTPPITETAVNKERAMKASGAIK